MTRDAKILMVYGVPRKQREALRKIADKKKQSISEMIREEYLNPIMKKLKIDVYETGRAGRRPN